MARPVLVALPPDAPYPCLVQPHTRYRHEHGTLCIDVRLRDAAQLFDYRDPAPFPNRDLDEDAVEYLNSAVQEVPRKTPFKIVFWVASPLTQPLDASVIAASVHAYFAYERDKTERGIRQRLRRGQELFWLGLAILVICLSLSEVLLQYSSYAAARIANHGLIIMGWVALWRPIEALLYDWWPLVRARRSALRLMEAPVEVLES